VAINRGGTWWTGDSPGDVMDYLRAYTAGGHPADEIRICACARCGGHLFGLHGDPDRGTARRTCRDCGDRHFIADSARHWPDCTPRTSRCVCRNEDFNLAVAYSLRKTGDVHWVTVGQRCTACGALGSFVGWKVDAGPTGHLVELT
jgi:hypothetical protein